jgi:hypothetical protein
MRAILFQEGAAMNEAEREHEIAEFLAVKIELEAKVRILNAELAPANRRKWAIEEELRGMDFFRGRRETVQSNRIQSVIYFCDKKIFQYGLEPRRVVVRDPMTIDRRAPLFEELMVLHESYGAEREQLRTWRADIEEVERAIKRLRELPPEPKPKPKTKRKKNKDPDLFG